MRGAGRSAYIAGQRLAFCIDGLNGGMHFIGGSHFVQMPQHQNGRLQQCCGVGDIFARYVWSRTVYRFKDGALVAEIGAGNKAQSTDQPRA